MAPLAWHPRHGVTYSPGAWQAAVKGTRVECNLKRERQNDRPWVFVGPRAYRAIMGLKRFAAHQGDTLGGEAPPEAASEGDLTT